MAKVVLGVFFSVTILAEAGACNCAVCAALTNSALGGGGLTLAVTARGWVMEAPRLMTELLRVWATRAGRA